MLFLTKADLNSNIRAYRLNQMLDNDDTILDLAELETLATVKDALFAHFDIDTIFSQTGTARHFQIVSWMKHIMMFKLYERVPDEQVPDRVVKLYNEAMTMLDKIAEGIRSVDLPRKPDETETGEVKTKFRWGSVPKRTN